MTTKAKAHTTVQVRELPACDMCGSEAHYDAKTTLGPWANLCPKCFRRYATGLGLGRGQKLVLAPAKANALATIFLAKVMEMQQSGALPLGEDCQVSRL